VLSRLRLEGLEGGGRMTLRTLLLASDQQKMNLEANIRVRKKVGAL